MRDLIAAAIAILLLITAASLATTLQMFRKRRRRARDSEQTLGRTIIAEIPAQDDLILFTEDLAQFRYGDRAVDKDRLAAVRILINGAVIAAYASARHGAGHGAQATSAEPIDDRPEGIARDRWDVVLELDDGASLVVECGAIRERVSQELARAVFDAVKRELERQNGERR